MSGLTTAGAFPIVDAEGTGSASTDSKPVVAPPVCDDSGRCFQRVSSPPWRLLVQYVPERLGAQGARLSGSFAG